MKKRFSKFLAGTFLFGFIAIGGLISLIFFPQSLFANQIEHGRFTIHYGADLELNESAWRQVLDDAYQTVSECELHNPDLHFPVFLAHNHPFNQIEGLQGGDVIARATAGNIVFKVKINAADRVIKTTESTVDLKVAVIHEMIHVLQADRYGLLAFSPLQHPPMWKLEGYPEYVARQDYLHSPTYSLASEIERFVKSEAPDKEYTFEAVSGHWMPSYYFKGRIMVEYLMDVKALTYDEILLDPRSEEEIFSEMLVWVETQSN